MRMICVDDEELILKLTVSLCRELPQKPEVEGFTRATDALEYLRQSTVDLAVLDINIPDMNGLSLAVKIKEQSPDTAIIFLTGYEEYALEAFRIHASGYLLKPVSRKELLEEVNYALSDKNQKPLLRQITAKTFGEFDLLVEGKTVSFSRAKSKELLAYLIDRNGSSVTRASLFAVLFEEKPYDRSGQKYLDVIIRSLRDTLSFYGAGQILEMQRGSLRIRPEELDCDLYRFLSGDIDAINSYRGEYMSAYSWASLTEAVADRIVFGRGG